MHDAPPDRSLLDVHYQSYLKVYVCKQVCNGAIPVIDGDKMWNQPTPPTRRDSLLGTVGPRVTLSRPPTIMGKIRFVLIP